MDIFWAIGGNTRLGDFRPYLAYYDNRIERAAGMAVAGGRTQHNRILALGLAAAFSAQIRMTAPGITTRTAA